MKTPKLFQMKSILWTLVGLIWLLTSCQIISQVEAPVENTDATNEPIPTIQLQMPTIPTILPDEGTLPLSTPLTQPSATAREQPTRTTTPIPMPTVTEDSFNSSQFHPQIALLGGEPDSYPAIGVFDTQMSKLEIIAQPTGGLSYGRPLWSPNKDLLAFAQFDSNTNTSSIQIYTPTKASSYNLEVTKPQVLDGDGTEPGLFLYGWSNNAEWLAYDYSYDEIHPDPFLIHLVNVRTQEDVSIELLNPENFFWFVWSSHNVKYAITDSEAIYIADPGTPNEMIAYQGTGFLGLIAWHPTLNEILVGSSRNMAGEGLNQLKRLNIDTGEWVNIGLYPNIAHFAFSPDGQFIAVHSQSRTLETYRLEIINANTFESLKQIELPSELFFDLDWLDNQAVALTSKDNIYVIPLGEQEKSYWILDTNNLLYEAFSQIAFTDW